MGNNKLVTTKNTDTFEMLAISIAMRLRRYDTGQIAQ